METNERIEELRRARQKITDAANNSYTRKHYGDESKPYLWYCKGIRDACWAIDAMIEELESKNKNIVYRYACRLRPPGPGAVPKDGLIYCNCNEIEGYEHHYWGYCEYDHQLSDEDMKHYDLDFVGPYFIVE